MSGSAPNLNEIVGGAANTFTQIVGNAGQDVSEFLKKAPKNLERFGQRQGQGMSYASKGKFSNFGSVIKEGAAGFAGAAAGYDGGESPMDREIREAQEAATQVTVQDAAATYKNKLDSVSATLKAGIRAKALAPGRKATTLTTPNTILTTKA